MAKHLLVFFLLLGVMTSSPGAARRSQGQAARVIEVTAQRFEFWPSEIRVRQGEMVELRIRSDDTMHGFRIVGAGVNLLVPKRGKGDAVAPLAATQPGRYTIECSRMCGAGHNFMRATLIVEPIKGSALTSRQPGSPPRTPARWGGESRGPHRARVRGGVESP